MLRLLRHIREHRYVIANFVARDLKVKYRGTVLGYLWSLLEPLALVGIYYFIFTVIAHRGQPDFVLVVILGLMPWTYFSSVVNGSATALRSNAGLVRSIPIPRDVYVVAASASNLVVLLLNMLAVIPFLLFYRVVPGTSVILWPVAILLITMLAVGIGLVASCANVVFKDVGYLLGVLLRMGMYFSAAIYPISMVPADMRFWFLFNPLAVCLSMARSAVLHKPMPFGTVHLVSAATIAFMTCWMGSAIFFRWERKAVKYL